MEQIQTSEINNLKYKQSATCEGKIFMSLKVNNGPWVLYGFMST